MSNNLGRTEIAPGMANPEPAVNDALGRLDAALTETITIDVSAADRAVTDTEAKANAIFLVTAGATLRTITLPAIKRVLYFTNRSTNPATLVRGTASYTLGGGASATVLLDGTANGLTGLGAGASGVPEPPADGKLYVRKRATNASVGEWVEYVPGAGGGTPTNPGATQPHKAWRLRVDSTNYTDGTALAGCQFRTTAGSNEPAGNFPGTNFGFPMIGSQYDRVMDDNIYTVGIWQDGSYPKYVGRIYDSPKAVLELALFSYNDTYTSNCLPRHPKSGALQYSDDSTNGSDGTWTTAASFADFNWTETQEIKLVPVT